MLFFRAIGLLTLAMLVTFAGTVWFSEMRHGATGVVAAVVAAGVCWLSAAIALLLLIRWRRSGKVVNGVLMGMVVRLGLPLIVGVVLDGQQGALANAGVFGLIVVSYMVALIVETVLSVWILQQPRHAAPSV